MTQEHRARKRFGQNFLHDPVIISRIISAIFPRSNENIVEIGPGLGALTAPLLKSTGQLQVIELDRDVIPHLKASCAGLGALTIHQNDALKFDFSTLAVNTSKLRIVGNLPYNISSPLLFHLLGYAHLIQDMHFMLQKEVVDRMAALPGEKPYGRLSASLAAHVRCEYLFKVKPGAFNPPPKVDSAIVRITPYTPGFSILDRSMYQSVIDTAFSTRRKTLSNALKPLCNIDDIRAVDIDPGLRAERVAPEEFAALANLLTRRQTV